MRTKWEILIAKRDRLAREADAVQQYLNALAATQFDSECTGCGVYLRTEKDFAAHFVVPNERLINSGSCPDKRV